MKPISGMRMCKLLESRGWNLDHISGSHHVDTARINGSWNLSSVGRTVARAHPPRLANARDGRLFLSELQRRGEGRSVPVIVLTAKDLTSADRQRLSGPIGKILRKGSLGHEQLLAEVTALLAR
jgi:CheY-like chemotaxis protein